MDPAAVAVAGEVDYNTAGNYTLEYSYTSPEGIMAVTKMAVVVVG